MITLSMIVKNEAETLPLCLKSIKDWVDEIVIVDTGSTDGTQDVIEAFGARLERFQWCDDFSAARNHALSFVRTPWVIWLDADDIILNPEILPELVEYAYRNKINGIWSVYHQDAASQQRRLQVFKAKEYRFKGYVHESACPRYPDRSASYLSDLEILHRKPPDRSGKAADHYLRILREKDPENWLGIAESLRFKALTGPEEEREAVAAEAEAYYWEAYNHAKVNLPTRYLCLYNAAALNLELAKFDAKRINLTQKLAMLGVNLLPDRPECLVLFGQAAQAKGDIEIARNYYTLAMKCPPYEGIGLCYREYYDLIPRMLLEELNHDKL